MHPVQAAPRQSLRSLVEVHDLEMHPVQAAPRQSLWIAHATAAGLDAPRAGSAEAK